MLRVDINSTDFTSDEKQHRFMLPTKQIQLYINVLQSLKASSLSVYKWWLLPHRIDWQTTRSNSVGCSSGDNVANHSTPTQFH
jgi:hypothetical protein